MIFLWRGPTCLLRDAFKADGGASGSYRVVHMQNMTKDDRPGASILHSRAALRD